MPYRSPVAEYKFVLAHVVGFEDVSSTETFAEATPDTVDAILTEVGKLAEDKLAPLNRNGDLYPAQLENGVIRTSKGFADGYAAIAEGGWIGLSAPADHGGMGLPLTLTCAVNDIFSGANMALGLNPLLTQGQIEALEHHAPDWMKELYLPKLISGEWNGTMNLTEPQAGCRAGDARHQPVHGAEIYPERGRLSRRFECAAGCVAGAQDGDPRLSDLRDGIYGCDRLAD